MLKEILNIASNNKELELYYLQDQIIDNDLKISPVKTKIYLYEDDKNTDLQKEFINYIKKENIQTIDFNVKELLLNNAKYMYLSSDLYIIHKLQLKIDLCSNLIAAESRIGKGDIIISNKNNIDLYNLTALTNLIIVENNYLDDNTLYINRLGKRDEPGYKLFYHKDLDNKLYTTITGLGMFPNKNMIKINIIK